MKNFNNLVSFLFCKVSIQQEYKISGLVHYVFVALFILIFITRKNDLIWGLLPLGAMSGYWQSKMACPICNQYLYYYLPFWLDRSNSSPSNWAEKHKDRASCRKCDCDFTKSRKFYRDLEKSKSSIEEII